MVRGGAAWAWSCLVLLSCSLLMQMGEVSGLHVGIKSKDVTSATTSPFPRQRDEVIIPGNDPGQCRCGEMIIRNAPNNHADIDPFAKLKFDESTTAEPSSNSTPTPLMVLKNGAGSAMSFFSAKRSGASLSGTFLDEDFVDYEPKRRPWLVVIRIQDFPPVDVRDITECTGAILSSRWVISSQSCLCGNEFGCDLRAKMEESKERTVQPYELYVASSWPDQSSNQRIGIAGISSPPKDMNTMGNDIVLVRLSSPLAFSEKIMPICLPQLKFKNDTREAYISGFRFLELRAGTTTDRCKTIAGPSRDKRCKNYKLQYNPEKVYDACTMESPPIARECLGLKKAMGWRKLLPEGLQKVTIFRNISQIDKAEREERFSRVKSDIVEIECFSENPSEFGWCGTCLNSAQKGEAGYCNDDEAQHGHPGADDEYARPTEFGGWGFCEKLCKSVPTTPDGHPILSAVLMETMRLLESRQDCQKHYKSSNNRFIHICLASLRFVHRRLAFSMLADGTFKEDPSNDIYVLNPDLKHVGDAGAPVFELTNVDEETGTANAFIIGVLSTSQDAPQTFVADNVHAKAFTEKINVREIITQILPQMKFIKEKLALDPPECIEKVKGS